MSPRLSPLPAGFAWTVASLHRVAEQLLAPARKPDNEIALEPTPGGFGTPEFEFAGRRQQVRVEGTDLVHSCDGEERRAPLDTLAAAGAILAELLPGGVELDSAPLAVEADAAAALAAWYQLGDEVLREMVAAASAQEEASAPILWPEHFDIAIELGSEAAAERATYGFSPGDENHPEPYAYVGLWGQGLAGELWQANGFSGAELGYRELLAAPDPAATAIEFFRRRRQALLRSADQEQ